MSSSSSRFPVGGGGRPAGARNRFSTAFLNDFLADWEQHGANAIKAVRLRDPMTYLRAAEELKQILLTKRQEQPILIEARKVDEPERA